jgi:hypothetical protein
VRAVRGKGLPRRLASLLAQRNRIELTANGIMKSRAEGTQK